MSRYIDADALKEWIDEYVSVFKKSDNKDIKGYIEHQPTIEPKRGEWIVKQSGFAECSVCEQHYFSDYNFCPNCGARMKGADDEQIHRCRCNTLAR